MQRTEILSPSILFLYSLSLTISAFVFRDIRSLLLILTVNLPIGIIVGYEKFKLFLIPFLISLIGVLINALIFAGGTPIAAVGQLKIRSGAIYGFADVSLRLGIMLSASLVFSSLTNPRLLLKSLETELWLPKEASFMVALSLRLLSIFEKDIHEIRLIRRSRGLRETPVTPVDWKSILTPLFSLGVQRGRWIGIAAETRGFRYRKPERKILRPSPLDLYLLMLLLFQLSVAYIVGRV